MDRRVGAVAEYLLVAAILLAALGLLALLLTGIGTVVVALSKGFLSTTTDN